MRILENRLAWSYCSRRNTDSMGALISEQPNHSGSQVRLGYLAKADILKSHRDSSGWRPPLPYSVLNVRESPPFGEVKAAWYRFGWQLQSFKTESGRIDQVGYLPRCSTTVPVMPHWVYQKAATQALLKLKRQNLNLAVALAESNRTAGLIARTVKDIYTAYKYTKRGNFMAACDALGLPRHKTSFNRKNLGPGSKKLAERWLELQYGWKPLLSDIYGAYNEARSHFDSDPRISTVAVSREAIASSTVMTQSHSEGKVKYLAFEDGFHRVKVRLDCSISSASLVRASKVGLTNPSEVVWELIPFSFVLDWIVPVGNWLSSFDASFGLTFIGGSVSRVTSVSRIHKIVGVEPSNDDTRLVSASGSAASGIFSFGREVLSSPPSVLPYIKNPVSVDHALNSIALLRTQLDRRSR